MFFCARNILASTQRVYIYLLFFILLYVVRRLAIIQNGAPGSYHLAYLSTFNIAECYGLFEPAGSALAHDIEMAVVTR